MGGGGLAAVFWALPGLRGAAGNAVAAGEALTLEKIPFNGARAYEELKRLCAIGPRPSGSAGMEAQQKLLAEHFEKLGARVEFQRFRVRHPQNSGVAVPMANIVVRWWPDRADRILLCAHYDTLPFPRMDPENPRGIFVGANDNASGVAVLMELGRDMADLQCRYGVDFVFLDGEEYVFSDRDPMYLGAEYFARQYKDRISRRLTYSYRGGVLLDMIGKKDLEIPIERNSASWRDTRPLITDLWAVAARLGVREFVPRKGQEVGDDHIILHNIGHIPCIDLIDFNYPPWHTQADTPDQCSPLSLAKVGWVIREWLQQAK
jgi:glutaminyl-peptide cyclotransferase